MPDKTNFMDLVDEVIAEEMAIVDELIDEEIMPLIQYKKEQEKRLFETAYKEVQELEKET